LLFPSALTALGGHHAIVMGAFGAILVAAILGLLLLPRIAALLETWDLTKPLGKLARAAARALSASPAGVRVFGIAVTVHLLTIMSVWSIARAQALAFPLADAAVLFTVMTAIAILPVSVGGWGLRELAVVALLQAHGISAEQALFFSVSFGLVTM